MQKNYKINNEIESDKIILLNSDRKYIKNTSIQEALIFANQKNLDLVEIGTKNGESICILQNYNKFLYKENKRDQHKVKKNTPRKLRIGILIDQNDLIRKCKQICSWLDEGSSYVMISILISRKKIKDPKSIKEKVKYFYDNFNDIFKNILKIGVKIFDIKDRDFKISK